MEKRPLIYLAGPYSHENHEIRLLRFESLSRAASRLMRDGHLVFSPISHGHPIAMAGGLPIDWEFWEAFSRVILKVSSRFIVLTMEGWETSTGVSAEIKIAKELGIEIEYMEPE